MNMIATTAAMTSTATAVAADQLSPVEDPIFSAIEAHKAAAASLVAVASRHGNLEKTIPRSKRQSSITSWEEKIVETDDPRWIEAERDLFRAFDNETDAACVLVSVRPTTQAGLFALVQHALLHDTDGRAWPTDLHSDDERNITRPWHYFLLENVAVALTLRTLQ